MIALTITDLPEPDSPTTPSVSPQSELERDPVDGPDRAPRRVEVHLEVLDVDQWAARLVTMRRSQPRAPPG